MINANDYSPPAITAFLNSLSAADNESFIGAWLREIAENKEKYPNGGRPPSTRRRQYCTDSYDSYLDYMSKAFFKYKAQNRKYLVDVVDVEDVPEVKQQPDEDADDGQHDAPQAEPVTNQQIDSSDGTLSPTLHAAWGAGKSWCLPPSISVDLLERIVQLNRATVACD